MTSHMRTLTFGDRSISYNEGSDDVNSEHEHIEHTDDDNDTDKDDSYPSSIYPCSDIDSGVCEDVCCDEHRDTLENVVETERKIIKPDVTAIREMTNFDEDEDDDLTEESDEDNDSLEESNSDNNEDEEDVLSANVFFNTKEAFTRRDDICLNGFEYHSLGPASLSVLQLNKSELVHMRHVMVKIELDSRLGLEEVDTMMGRVESGRVCVVCTRTKFNLFTSGLECSVCRYAVCRQCTGMSESSLYSGPALSLPSSPTPPVTSSSLSSRLGTLFTRRRSSVSDSRSGIICRPCSQFVQQVLS